MYKLHDLSKEEIRSRGFQNLDKCRDWEKHDPIFKWSRKDLEEFEREQQMTENELKSLAAWWEWEGVRCWTFGKPRNPYNVRRLSQ